MVCTDQKTDGNPPPKSKLEDLYEQYFAPRDDIPSDRLFAGASLRQPDAETHIQVISVYDNSGDVLTF